MQTQPNWEILASHSHYQTAVAVQQLLREGKFIEASEGLDALIAAMERAEKRALRSQLIRLMSHIIKWKCQPERRSRSWILTILDAREEIEEIQAEVFSLNRDFIESVWDKCFKKAVIQAEDEMGKECQLTSLSWKEVFEDEYSLLQSDSES